MIQYKTIENFNPGIFLEITKRCYEPLFNYFPDKKSEFHQQWEESDKATFDHPAIGKCVFVSCINEKPIGFASWDPRIKPVGIIGQNCILPEYQGKGFGKKQILKVIEIVKKSGFQKIRVTTGDHEFFIPAHKMYEGCGFKEIKMITGELFDLVEYERVL
ncbi:MAG: GNAT family N-acetyltransferase [Planctomycetota bacterium]|jgi:GNAT superfamily N-acetyltransferase